MIILLDSPAFLSFVRNASTSSSYMAIALVIFGVYLLLFQGVRRPFGQRRRPKLKSRVAESEERDNVLTINPNDVHAEGGRTLSRGESSRRVGIPAGISVFN